MVEFDPTSRPSFENRAEQGATDEGRGSRFRIFGFPLHIDPWFFLTASLIGGRQELGLLLGVFLTVSNVQALRVEMAAASST